MTTTDIERFEDLYSKGQLDDTSIKIEVTPKHDDFDDFLDVRSTNSDSDRQIEKDD